MALQSGAEVKHQHLGVSPGLQANLGLALALGRIATGQGFIAALDQSGGSTPKALRGYGVEDSEWSGDDEMFAQIHAMRARVITSPCFGSGKVIGATDEIGLRAAQDPVTMHDLHATLLSLLGMDHKRLTYFFQGRDFRLTDVAGRVLKPILT